MLIKSNNVFKYRQLLSGSESVKAVQALEGLPKVVGRARTYSESGSALARNNERDEDEAGRTDGFRWLVESKNRNLLRAMQLPDWDVWRFSSYVGLHPQERLFVGSNEAVNSHYQKVQSLREPKSSWSNLLRRSYSHD